MYIHNWETIRQYSHATITAQGRDRFGPKVTDLTFQARVRVHGEERKKSMCVNELYQTYNRIVCHFYILTTHLIIQNITNELQAGN